MQAKAIGIIFIITNLFITYSLFAHAPKGPPHGGRVYQLADLTIEMIMKEKMIHVYITDERWRPLNVSGASANALILAGKKFSQVALMQDGKYKFVSLELDKMEESLRKIIIRLQMPGQESISAIFRL